MCNAFVFETGEMPFFRKGRQIFLIKRPLVRYMELNPKDQKGKGKR